MRLTNPIEIKLDVPSITRTCASGILRTIVELLLYQRNQIPFLYATFRSMIKKWEIIENKPSDEAVAAIVSNMHLTKQRTQAKQTFYNTELLFEMMDKILVDYSSVRELMILFGRTIYTAKEAIVVNLPPIHGYHLEHNQRDKIAKYHQQIARTLSLSHEHIDNMQVQDATNMFVLIKLSVIPQQTGSSNIVHALDEFQLPSKCVQFIINLKPSEIMSEQLGAACNKFSVFEEKDETSSLTDDEPESTIEMEAKTTWHQLDVTVKGFKLAFRKGCQIWD